MTEQTAKRLEKLLLRLLANLDPTEAVKRESQASVTSVSVESGTVREDEGSGGDVPSQISVDYIPSGVNRKYRRVTTVKR